MNAYITGAYTTQFGELWDISPRTLAREAIFEALKDAHTDLSQVDALFVGNMLSGMLGGQEHLGAFFSEAVGINVPAVKIEGACASGGLAVHQGVTAVLSGLYKTVVVVGVEKMTDHKPDDVATALMGAGSDMERVSGGTFPGMYAMLARAHMNAYNTTEEDFAAVAVKNHYHASLNPKAQFHNLLTIEKVLQSSRIADPLKLLDCSPITDGAAAVVITSVLPKQKRKQAVQVLASSVATDTLGLAQRKSLLELSATRRASQKAFSDAGLTPKDISIVELHDCFSIAEIFALEDLGFFSKGKAAHAVRSGMLQLGNTKGLVSNTSGGLKGCGHPVGATGVKQVVEIVDQLFGRAGKRQVETVKYGLTQNVGGSGATSVVHIFQPM